MLFKQSKWLGLIILLLVIAAAVVCWKVPVQEGLDLVGGVRGVYLATSQTPGHKVTQTEMDTTLAVIDRRVNALGVSETQVQQKGADQIIVEIPLSQKAKQKHITATQAQQMLLTVVKPAVLKFVELPDGIRVDQGQRNAKGEETFKYYGPNSQPMTEAQALAEEKVVLTGSDLLSESKGEFSPDANKGYEVSLHFNDRGAQIFGDYTTSHVGKHFGVTLDNRMITYPVIESPIPDGRGVISGGFNSLEDAQNLAILLNAGALPVNLKALQSSLIEATLGASAVAASIWAGVAGLVLVILFMWAYYRLPGFLASMALLIYAVLVFAIFKLIPVTLTLPGIAGFILSVGMAVDANILIFERLKEELREGRTLRSAIDAGFGRALTAIVDSNACTLITCGVLGFYGTGPVKGFAVTLAIGVLVSLFTAITVTRTFLHLLDNTGALQRPELFGTNIQWMGKWAERRDIIGRRKLYYTISGAVIVPGLIFLGASQLRRGVDFTGGNEWIVQSRQQLSDTKMIQALRDAGIPRNDYDLQIGQSLQTGDKLATIHSKPGRISPRAQKVALDSLHRSGVVDATTASNETISPIIGKELETNALLAVLISSVLIVLYLSFRFAQHGFKDGVKYGVCAIVAMLHDVLVVIGLFAIFGFIFQVEIDMNFVTAVLTIIGFSVHDTIVIFDRVRENLGRRRRDETFEETYNRSIVQTAARSINTSFTVLLVLVALLVLGAPVIRWFDIALLIGIISGTYSSIFNASPLVVDWQIIKRRREAEMKAASVRAIGAAPGAGARPGRAPAAGPGRTSQGRTGTGTPATAPRVRPSGGNGAGGNGSGRTVRARDETAPAGVAGAAQDTAAGENEEAGSGAAQDPGARTARPASPRPGRAYGAGGSRAQPRRKQRY